MGFEPMGAEVPRRHFLTLWAMGLCILLALLFVGYTPLHAATITVDAGAPDPDSGGTDSICSLREAIESFNEPAADELDCAPDRTGSYGTNDTIIVPAETILMTLTGGVENSNLNGDLDVFPVAPLTIRVAGGGSATINRGDDERIFHIYDCGGSCPAPNVTLVGLTITGGEDDDGGGIYLKSGWLTLQDCIVTDNEATGTNGGGGIFLEVANDGSTISLVLDNTTISFNEATAGFGVGGGIGTDVVGNFNSGFGGSAGDRAVFITVRNNSQIVGNTAVGSGGGIFAGSISNVTLEIEDSVFDANLASGVSDTIDIDDREGGGALFVQAFEDSAGVDVAAFVSISDSQFTNNTASGADAAGGAIGIVSESVDVHISHSEISENHLTGTNEGQAGGGIALFGALKGDSTMLVNLEEETEVSDNDNIAGGGGGLYVQMGRNGVIGIVDINITETTLARNEAFGAGGAVIVSNGLLTTPSSLTLEDVTIADNTASGSGGGLLTVGGSSITNISINRTTVSGNIGETNVVGGLLFQGNLTPGLEGTALITNSTFFDNSATTNGGVTFANYGSVELINCTIAENSATDTEGGGLSSVGTDVLLTNTILFNNTATTIGPDCLDPGGLIVSGGFNIFTPNSIDANCLGLDGALDPVTDQETNPLLDAFDDSDPFPGRQTLPLLAGSPAIDNADSAVCEATAELNQDQILTDRVDLEGFGSDAGDLFQCDVGAREFGTVCGNDVVEDGEDCDDGDDTTDFNNNFNDCKNDCTLNVCGDGAINVGVETCEFVTFVPDGCVDCTLEEGFESECGDGLIDPNNDELCDTHDIAGVPCGDDCQPVLGCGNGVVEDGEECDDGDALDDRGMAGNFNDCKNDCTRNVCGDGIINVFTETCEFVRDNPDADPPESPPEGCNDDCTIEADFEGECGDELIDFTSGELCDGNEIDGVPCGDDCQLELETTPEAFDSLCVGGGCSTCNDETENPFTASLRGGERGDSAPIILLMFLTLIGLVSRRVKY